MASSDHFVEENCVDLKDGLDLQDLQDPQKGAIFEVNMKQVVSEPSLSNDYFKAEEVYKNILSVDDEMANFCVSEGLDQFEGLMKKMVDITKEKDGGVMKKLHSYGAGPLVPDGALVWIHYNAYRRFDDEPFDSTRLRQDVYKFRLGLDGGILGLHVAVASMKKGERSYFMFKPDYYYGEMGCPPRVPPDCTVLFDIEVLRFIERDSVDDYEQMTLEERRKVSFDFVSRVSKSERTEGNQMYNSGKYKSALGKYHKAALALEDYHLKNEDEEVAQKELLKKVYLNIAACCLKLKQNGSTITYCHKVLSIDPREVKAYYRKGEALHSMGEFTQARQQYLKAMGICGSNTDISRALKKLDENIKRFKIQDEGFKRICQRMMTSSLSSAPAPAPASSASQHQPDLPKECSENFRKTVREKFREFQNDDSMTEMPFPERSLTVPEISCIVEESEVLGMHVRRRGTGQSSRMVVVKTKEMLFKKEPSEF